VTRCLSCGEDVPATAKFCQDCGKPVPVRSCPACGAPAERGRFCSSCGTTLRTTDDSTPVASAPRQAVERRVTSVLFADLVGFTPLSEARDPEEVRDLLSQYFAVCGMVVTRYGGTVEKFIGDAVMAVWGFPTAHEDDAERAVRAGLELVEVVAGLGVDLGLPGLAMRVGVVTGEVAVTVGAVGDAMVAGDAVNTASRVQAVAEPGRVWVDDSTRALTSAAVTYVDAGQHSLKGKTQPTQLWRAGSVVAEVGGGQRVDGLEAPLAGRFRELRLLKELYHSSEESLRPRLVVLDGGPGVGKSRLAWEFEKYIDGLSSTAWWHRGRCLSYGDGVAFWALGEAIRGRLKLVESDSGDIVGQHLENALVEFVPDVDERNWLRPRVATIVGAGRAEGFAREDLFAAWATFFERVGKGEHAVILVLDDAQYADDGLLDFLDYLLETANAGIFVLALARPELLARRPDLGGRRTTVVRLEPLDDTAMAELVDGLITGLPRATRATLVERAEGVPLFAVETVRALIDRDAVVPRDGQYVPAEGIDLDLAAIGAPASLQALVAARLDALTAQERHVVAAASVLGMSFTREGLLAVCTETDDLDAILISLQRKEILSIQQDRMSATRGQHRFVQSVVRQVAYGTQSRYDRKARHLMAAKHLAAQQDPSDDLSVLIAQHLLDAVDASTDSDSDVEELTGRACAMLERAARRARSLGAPLEALRLFESALARTGDEADQARLRLASADSALDAGLYEKAFAYAREAAAIFDVRDLIIEAGIAAAVQATALIWSQDNAGAIEVAEPRWEALDGMVGAERALLSLGEALSTAHSFRGEQSGHIYGRKMVVLAEALNDPDALAAAHLKYGSDYQWVGAPVTAMIMYESSRAIAKDHGLFDRLALALINMTTIQISRDLAAALEYASDACDAARRSGNRNRIDYATFNYLLALWVAGRFDEVRSTLTIALEVVGEASDRMTLTTVEAWLADAQGVPLPANPFTDHTDYANAQAWRGNLEVTLALARGDAVGAARSTERVLTDLLTACGLEDDFMHLWPPLVQTALAAGDTALAERLLAPVTSAAPGLIAPAVKAQLHRLQGLLGAARDDDPERVEADLRAGVAALDAFGAVGLCAQAKEELGRWLVGQRRGAEAQALLEQARATYADIGAVGWLARLNAWHEPGTGQLALSR
jgi:class 3 adenylate cyclase/tetratricopeptide (TPR) repeat protein